MNGQDDLVRPALGVLSGDGRAPLEMGVYKGLPLRNPANSH